MDCASKICTLFLLDDLTYSLKEQAMQKKQICLGWLAVVFVWYVMNIRVEAGISTIFERTMDCLVGGTLFLVALYYAARFFDFLEVKD